MDTNAAKTFKPPLSDSLEQISPFYGAKEANIPLLHTLFLLPIRPAVFWAKQI